MKCSEKLQRCLIKLLMATGGNPSSNLDSNTDPNDKILNRQSASILNTNDIQKQTIPPQKDYYKLDSTDTSRLPESQVLKEQNKLLWI